MHPLSASDVLAAWEEGQHHLPVDRALTLLAIASPERSWDELATLSVGARDALLLALREETLGPILKAFVECPQCGAGLELDVAASDIRVPAESAAGQGEHELSFGGFVIGFRLPDSRDLAELVGSDGAGAARRLLLRRCVSSATCDSTVVQGDTLPDGVASALAARMAELDPQADVLLHFACPECEHAWEMVFDVGDFFWTEVTALAGRLLREVDTLARAYGWWEADILAMSARRRDAYLALAGA